MVAAYHQRRRGGSRFRCQRTGLSRGLASPLPKERGAQGGRWRGRVEAAPEGGADHVLRPHQRPAGEATVRMAADTAWALRLARTLTALTWCQGVHVSQRDLACCRRPLGRTHRLVGSDGSLALCLGLGTDRDRRLARGGEGRRRRRRCSVGIQSVVARVAWASERTAIASSGERKEGRSGKGRERDEGCRLAGLGRARRVGQGERLARK